MSSASRSNSATNSPTSSLSSSMSEDSFVDGAFSTECPKEIENFAVFIRKTDITPFYLRKARLNPNSAPYIPIDQRSKSEYKEISKLIIAINKRIVSIRTFESNKRTKTRKTKTPRLTNL